MTRWPRWALDGEPLALAGYVLPDGVGSYLPIPGPSGESRLRRLRMIYDLVARVQIGYAYDAPSDEAGRQVIRPPEQVLWAPRHATCLDLAVMLAGACVKAGLHPVVVVLDPPTPGHGHALVLVQLDHDLRLRVSGSPGDDVWTAPPATLLDELQRTPDGPGSIVAVDPVGVAVSLGTATTRGLGVDFAAAVASGARYLTGVAGFAGWTWRVGVDIGSSWRAQDTLPPPARPATEPLRPPYREPETAPSPLRLLRAEYRVVPFQARHELTVLRDWCAQVTAGDRTGVAVVHGVGGSGKTRLTLELVPRFANSCGVSTSV